VLVLCSERWFIRLVAAKVAVACCHLIDLAESAVIAMLRNYAQRSIESLAHTPAENGGFWSGELARNVAITVGGIMEEHFS
jgi:hypothetical protein